MTLAWCDSPLLGGFGGDNAVYWLTARHWSPWSADSTAAAHVASRSFYPPLYPAVLAGLGGGISLRAAHWVSGGLLGVGLCTLAWFATLAGCTPRVALAVAALAGASRVFLLEALEIHSEHLFLPLSLAALALATQVRAQPASLLPLSACIAAVTLTRSAGLALLAAYLAWLCLMPLRGRVLAGVLACVPYGVWTLFDDGTGQYVGGLGGIYGRHGVLDLLIRDVQALWTSWFACFAEPGQAGFRPALAVVVAVLAASGTLLRVRARALDGWYVLATLALIVCWPYPAEYERLLYPLWPVLCVHAMLAALALARVRLAGFRYGVGAALVLVLAVEIPFLVLVGERLVNQPGSPQLAPFVKSSSWFQRDRERAIATVGYEFSVSRGLTELSVRNLVPDDACLLTTKPSIAALFADRRAFPLPAFSLPPRDLVQALERQPCPYLFLTASPTPAYPEPFFPYFRIPTRLEILAEHLNPTFAPGQRMMPAAMLVRFTQR